MWGVQTLKYLSAVVRRLSAGTLGKIQTGIENLGSANARV
jgi:hypothetical protein